jgi:hypothetical protein
MKVTIEVEHQEKSGWRAWFKEMPQYSACGPTQREAAQRLVTLVLEVLNQGNTQSTWLHVQNQLEIFGAPPRPAPRREEEKEEEAPSSEPQEEAWPMRGSL